MNESWIKALLLACIFGAVLLAVEALISWFGTNRAEGHAINTRLKMIGQGRSREEAMNMLRRPGSAVPQGLPPIIARLALKLERMLTAAQIRMPTGRLMVLLLLAPVAVFFAVVFIMVASGTTINFSRLLIVATFAGVAGAMIPIMLLNFKATRTRKKMEAQFPVALDVFVRGLRAGHPIAAALDLLTVEMADPIGSEFGIVVDEVTYGAELRDALQDMADRWDLDDMRMFIVSLSVQSETGGNLAEILENLSSVIRERHTMFLKVRALSSEGRMTAVMLSVLPVFAFMSIFLLSPSFYLDVADDPAFIPSYALLAVMYVIGFIIIRRLVDLKV